MNKQQTVEFFANLIAGSAIIGSFLFAWLWATAELIYVLRYLIIAAFIWWLLTERW